MTQTLPPSPRPILIAGPTASGKSALALRLAEETGGVIVNADALQVYGCWRVLTARPSEAEEARAPHRLYGHVGRAQPYSVGHWLREVGALLAGLGDRRAIIVGGTGLYFMALTEGLAEIPEIPAEIRAEAEAAAPERLARALREEDPETAAGIDMANPARVRRAWEVLRATGRGLARWQAETPPPLLPPKRAHRLVLEAPREWLAERIDRRFDAMMAEGALEEVAAYVAEGWEPTLPSAQAIGARELAAHLWGEMSLDEAVAAAKLQTRRYAKRQRTWFRRRMGGWRALHPEDHDTALREIATGGP